MRKSIRQSLLILLASSLLAGCSLLPSTEPIISTPVPQPAAIISASNVQQVTQLARWGKGPISQVVWSPDGNQLVVASTVGIHFYDAQTLQQVQFIDTNNLVDSIAFSPDGELLASSLRDDTVKLWEVSTGREISTLEGHA